MDIIVTVDTRERAIHDHLRARFLDPPTFGINTPTMIIEQLDVADILISAKTATETRILAAIERKTLADYAASLKDGRILNLDKLIKLREESGCQLYYLIEGGSPSLTTQIAGIDYANILASIRDTQILHSIQTIQSANKHQTASEIRFLAERYGQLYDRISQNFIAGGGINEIVQRTKPTETQLLRAELITIWTNVLSKSDKIKMQVKPSLSAPILAQRFTLRRWLNGKITREQADEIRVGNNRLQGKIVDLITSPMPPEIQHKALSCIKNITPEFATAILAVTTIENIITDPKSSKLTIMPSRTLGKARREKIRTLFLGRIQQ